MRIGVLASGSGTILAALVAEALPISLVVVDRPCLAEQVAREAGLELEPVYRESFGADFDRVAYGERLAAVLRGHGIELVVMAGFGTVVPGLASAFPDRVLNTHPALLPAFKGWHAVADALAAGVKVTGCTVHVATAEVDEGRILAQEAVAVLPDDDEETLHERIKAVERRLYPAAIRAYVVEVGSSGLAAGTPR